MTSQETPRRGGAVWALVITSVAGFMAALDNLVVTTALPSIREDLGGGMDDLEWTVSAYTLTFAVLLMFGAALGERSSSSPGAPVCGGRCAGHRARTGPP
ncbi:hypothetical protein GCM10010307_38070 [Streptomyces vastus]|uniref:Major facilitator superfamily (MFS) profile domain-containing protein n=1 Tax=Streptomyces vastus TaxID=285451 RepID=A0ABP6DBK6_9ACTN